MVLESSEETRTPSWGYFSSVLWLPARQTHAPQLPLG